MKSGLEKPINPLGEVPTKNKIEYSHWQPVQQTFLLLVDRAGRPPTVGSPTVGKAVDRTVDRSSQTESVNSLSVDQNKQRALLFLPVDRVGRPMCTHAHWCMSVDRQSSSARLAVDRAVDRTRPKTQDGNRFEVRIFLINFL